MSIIEIRKELHKFIEIGNIQFLDTLYKTAQSYIELKRLDKMIAEGEDNIKAGKIYTLKEAKKKTVDNRSKL